MLVTLVYLLFAGFVGIELFLNLKFKKLGRLTEKHPGLGLALSLGISLALALMFPATGLVVLIASVISTSAIQPFYILRNRVAKMNQNSDRFHAQWVEFKETWIPILRVFKYVILIATCWLWGPVLIRRWYRKNFSKDDATIAVTA